MPETTRLQALLLSEEFGLDEMLCASLLDEAHREVRCHFASMIANKHAIGHLRSQPAMCHSRMLR